MSGNKRKISSGSEISFSELKQLAEDGDAIAQNKLAFFRGDATRQPDETDTIFKKPRDFSNPRHSETSRGVSRLKDVMNLG